MTIRLVCGIQGKQLTDFGNLKNIRDISFSPDGQQLLVTKLDDNTARLWDFFSRASS
ncbi:hypothetical protein [Nostoc sp.]